MDELAECFKKQGAEIVGAVPAEGYQHTESKSVRSGYGSRTRCLVLARHAIVRTEPLCSLPVCSFVRSGRWRQLRRPPLR